MLAVNYLKNRRREFSHICPRITIVIIYTCNRIVYNLNVYAGPWDGSENQCLRTLHVQDQQVHGGVAHGHQQAVQGEALHL